MDDRIRVLEPDGDEPPRHHRQPRGLPPLRSLPVLPAAVAIGLLGLLVGYVFGAARAPAPSPPIQAEDLSGVDHNADPAVATPFGQPVPEAHVTGETSPGTTSLTTTTTTTPPARLSELVPGFRGTMSWVDYAGKVHRWNSGAREPRAIDVPIESWGHDWNAEGTRLLYVSGNRTPALYVGVPGAEEPLALQVTMARWHATHANRFAWLGSTDAQAFDERVWEAPMRLSVAELESSTRQVATLDVAAGFEHTEWYLMSWNDDGFALIRSSWNQVGPEWESAVVILDASGAVVFEEAGLEWLASRPDGSVLVAEARYNAIPTQDDRNARIVLLDGSTEPVDIDSNVWTVAYSPDGSHRAQIDGHGRLSLRSPSETTTFTRLAHSVTWGPDGRFVVATLNEGRFFLFYDLETRAEYIVKSPGSAYDVAIH